MLFALASSGLNHWQGLWLCLRKKNLQDRQGPLAADQASADDWLWDGLAEGLRKFHFIYRALCRKNLHHLMRITELPTQALFGQERD